MSFAVYYAAIDTQNCLYIPVPYLFLWAVIYNMWLIFQNLFIYLSSAYLFIEWRKLWRQKHYLILTFSTVTMPDNKLIPVKGSKRGRWFDR